MRFEYPKEMLRWVCCGPNYNKDLMVGVQSSEKKKLFGFLAGMPVTCKINGQKFKSVYINFLVVHKKLRDKKLAPLLIEEIKRRISHTNVYTAIYTSGQVTHPPFANTQFWHKQLNAKKNLETGYTTLPQNMSLARYLKQFKIS